MKLSSNSANIEMYSFINENNIKKMFFLRDKNVYITVKGKKCIKLKLKN